jgi:Uncharacterised nucleotidyltransferase
MTETLPNSAAPSATPQRAKEREREFDLLCATARGELAPRTRDRIANWDFSSFDRTAFLRLAEHHGVLPLAARNLIEHVSGLPLEIHRALRSAYEENLRRSLWFTAELVRIVQHFERCHVRAVPYKGSLLAQSLYGDPGLRSFSDLDFLISSVDFERAKQALADIGYLPSAVFMPTVEQFWLRKGYERSFDGLAGKYLVELQWALLPYFYAIELPVEDLLARARTTIVGGYEMCGLSPEDSLVALCLHAGKHLWTRLIWLADIAETVRTQTVDYSLMLSRARALGVARILGVSFWLAKNVLDAELPTPAEEMIESDSRISSLGREFAERLARGRSYDFESTEYFRLIMELRERRRDRWRYLWRLFWTPGAGDLAAVQLPETLFPLYHGVRIGRLIRRLT